MNDSVYLSIICASIILLVTAFALGTPGLKSEGPSERATLLRLPTPEGGNLKGLKQSGPGVPRKPGPIASASERQVARLQGVI
jgi:hypothetical protein